MGRDRTRQGVDEVEWRHVGYGAMGSESIVFSDGRLSIIRQHEEFSQDRGHREIDT